MALFKIPNSTGGVFFSSDRNTSLGLYKDRFGLVEVTETMCLHSRFERGIELSHTTTYYMAVAEM